MTVLPLSLISDDPQSWTTDSAGNQTPAFWIRETTPNGKLMLWPTRGVDGGAMVIDAWAKTQPECVHKLIASIASDELPGRHRAIIWPGQSQVYKIFHGPSSTRLFRQVNGLAPGRRVKLTAAILPDTGDIARGANGKLEPDHCRMSIALNDELFERAWSKLQTFHDYPGNERPWNVFAIETVVPESGAVTVEVRVQQNWPDDPSGVAWFFGPFTLEYVDIAPPDPNDDGGHTDPPPPVDTTEIDNLKAVIAQMKADAASQLIRIAQLQAAIDDLSVPKQVQVIVIVGDGVKVETIRSNVVSDAEKLGLLAKVYRE